MSLTATKTRSDSISRRAQIMAETLKIVGRRGYHGFGISELAELCGLTKPGLLHHFGTKEQLLIAVLEDCEAKEKAELSALFLPAYATANQTTQRKMFRETMHKVMARAITRPELMRLDVVLRAEAINRDHPAHEFFRGREEANRARIVERIAPLYANADSVARQVLAAMAGLQEQWLREGESFDLPAEWDRALTALLR